MHVVRKWAYIGLPIVEEVSSNTLQSCNNGKERNWVAINDGTLVVGEEECLDAFI
jgi:hypothetical protein